MYRYRHNDVSKWYLRMYRSRTAKTHVPKWISYVPKSSCTHMRLPISDYYKLTSYLAPFPRYSLRWVQNRNIWLPLLHLVSQWRGSLHHIIVRDVSLKTTNYGLHLCRRKSTYIFNHFYAVRAEIYARRNLPNSLK